MEHATSPKITSAATKEKLLDPEYRCKMARVQKKQSGLAGENLRYFLIESFGVIDFLQNENKRLNSNLQSLANEVERLEKEIKSLRSKK